MAAWSSTGKPADLVAGYRAIAAVSQALVAVLEEAANAPGAEFADLPVALVQGGRLADGMSSGLSVYLRHVEAGRPAANQPPPEGGGNLALSLHYLVTAWAESADVQQRVLGWCLRTLHAMPVLPARALQGEGEDVFGPTETVSLELEPLSAAELRDTWPAAGPLPPSLAYRVRSLQIR